LEEGQIENKLGIGPGFRILRKQITMKESKYFTRDSIEMIYASDFMYKRQSSL
jgi:hypothetical protein